MTEVRVLVEVAYAAPDALSTFDAAIASEDEGVAQVEAVLAPHLGDSVQLINASAPIPMFTQPTPHAPIQGQLESFSIPEVSPDVPSVTAVIPAVMDESTFARLERQPGLTFWQDSELVYFDTESFSQGDVECPPYGEGSSITETQELLGVASLWDAGFKGEGIKVGILDQGIDGSTYPVTGGFSRPNAPPPGSFATTTHGSMCAADVLIAAPELSILDYPFLGIPTSGGALAMFNAALEQRRIDGTPQLLSNSYGFTSVPTRDEAPGHEVWDLAHPLHRKIREVVASGAPVFFAAGNCGQPCPSANCHESGVGRGRSIHGSNSLSEVITVAAVTGGGRRIGYSSQGPGMFDPRKPDIAAYSHIYANFGHGRPGGTFREFDSGTSAACPVAAGVGALLMQAVQGSSPEQLKSALIEGASGGIWDDELGAGVIRAGESYRALRGNDS